MPYARINAAQVYYQQTGVGPDVVFLHGAGGNHLSWWQQTSAMAAAGYRCTSWDARGWGLSRGEIAVGRWAFGPDLVALLEHLDIARAHVVAQSMGGRAVAGLSRLAPQRIRSLVLCGTTAGATNDRIRELQDELRDIRGDATLREFALAEGFEAAQPALAHLYRQINSLNPPRPAGMLGRPPATYRGSMHDNLGALAVPVQFIVGEHDLITSPEMIREAAALIPGAAVHEIKGAGHSAYFEAPAEWNQVVLDFLSQVP
ncbi:MAG: alpha/beta fold hydrolase [Dehalococcoidia bacterium]